MWHAVGVQTGLVPHIAFVIGDAMPPKKRAVFVLKCYRPVVFVLGHNIRFHIGHLGCADGKRAITGLPMKLIVARALRAQPVCGIGFQLACHVRDGVRARQAKEQMNMVGNAADLDRVAIESIEDARKIGVEFGQRCIVENRVAVFGAEHEMNGEVGERLRHGVLW